MALGVDSFSFLLNEVSYLFTKTKDILALLGAAYAIYQTANGLIELYKVGRNHIISSLIHQDFVKKYGKWAIVTGCTSGIGEAFVREFAKRNMNIILIGRDRKKLDSLANDVTKLHGIETCVLVADFLNGRPAYANFQEAIINKEIGILVNNAGVMYDYPEEFLNVSQEKLWEIILVNIASVTVMTHIVLPHMVNKRRGAIITMSSSAAYQPTPLVSIYSASKAYLDYALSGIHQEYASKGIVFQTLIPFYIATRMVKYSSFMSKANIFIPSPEVYVRHALCTLGWSHRTTGYLPHTVLMWFAWLIPSWMWSYGALIMNKYFRNHASKK